MAEEDPDAPSSGPWAGFYTYPGGGKGRMDLLLRFKGGRVDGSGTDPVGLFVIRGVYSAVNEEVRWTKVYPGSHEVFYRGFRDARGIWGVWDIPGQWKGGFRIWPKGSGAGEEMRAEEEVPVEIEKGVPVLTPNNCLADWSRGTAWDSKFRQGLPSCRLGGQGI